MKQFFKFVFASMLGFLISFLVLIFILIGMMASVANFSKRQAFQPEKQSILQLSFDSEVIDRGGGNPWDNIDFMSFQAGQSMGLNDLLKNLKKAAGDENIEGIFLDMSVANAGWATVGEIRQGLLEFKESEKFIIAYGEVFTQNAYYLASIADEIYLHPEGAIDFRGINAETVFLKHLLDRLGIDPQLIRHGKYKSAGETFVLDKMSEENREQTLAFISNIWNNVLKEIGDARGLSINQLSMVADGFLTRNAELALENEMIDGIKYRDEVLELLREKTEKKRIQDIKLVSFSQYDRAPVPKSMIEARSRDKIAVVYAAGNIVSGQGSDRVIGSDRIAAAIREARLDTTVKAIVFRINSPGGSALASDVILREVKLAAAEKPLIASMGNVAASGGYYIAAGAHQIMASPNTITGSIGVFGMIPNMGGFFKDKLGVTFDNVKTNEFADLGSVSRPLTRAERAIITEEIEKVYDTFTGHVAQGRNMPVELVDELGQGRVWSGVEALQAGLIDAYGGLQDAIEWAASEAGLEKYRVVDFPERKDFLTSLMEDFGGIRERRMEQKLGPVYRMYREAEEVSRMSGVLMRMPYDIHLD